MSTIDGLMPPPPSPPATTLQYGGGNDLSLPTADDFEGIANRTLVIDGTSAAKKTTLLQLIGDKLQGTVFESAPEIVKCQAFCNAERINTFAPSTLGYVYSGMETLRQPARTCDGFKLMDRSPLNPIEWRLLWRCMDDFVRKHGNVRPTDQQLSGYAIMFEHLRQTAYYSELRKKFVAIAIIDTHVERCDRSRALRQIKSDVVRSTWNFYTSFQNMMYRTLYPKYCIDLAGFTLDDDLQCALHLLADRIVELIKLYPLAQWRPAPMRLLRLPALCSNDLVHDNTRAAVYRDAVRSAKAHCMAMERSYEGPKYTRIAYKETLLSQSPSFLSSSSSSSSSSNSNNNNNSLYCATVDNFEK